MEFWLFVLGASAVIQAFLIFFLNDMRKLDIEFLQDDIASLRKRLDAAANRHNKLKDAIREAVTDDE